MTVSLNQPPDRVRGKLWVHLFIPLPAIPVIVLGVCGNHSHYQSSRLNYTVEQCSLFEGHRTRPCDALRQLTMRDMANRG